jgi:hypothetical protein
MEVKNVFGAIPKLFWLLIVGFICLQLFFLPIMDLWLDSAADLVLGISIVMFVIYPIFVITTFIYLKHLKKINNRSLGLATLFLAVPMFTYLPFFS